MTAVLAAALSAALVLTPSADVVSVHDDLRDLAPAASGPFDHARALAVLVPW